MCRSAAGDCDVAETCTGAGGACPANQLAPASQVCRPSAGECDLHDRCTGITPVCPDDARKLPGVVCRAASGPCDVAEVCNGDAACPADGVEPSGTVCRAKAGFCDVAETCNGTSSACPDDAFVLRFTLCRRPGAIVEGGESVGGFGECDLSESCTGSDAQCPADVLRAPEFVCGPSLGPCDFEETCLAGGKNCPSDVKRGPGTQCSAPDSSKLCDAGGVCAGGGSDDCPATNSPKAAGTVCRESGGFACDPTDVCDGTSLDCPAEAPAPAGTVCTEAAQCREASLCSGDTGTFPNDYFCPSQEYSPRGTPCGAAETECREAGFCTIVGRCATPPKANGTPCDLSATEPGRCSAGTCVAITCQYNIGCPDGAVCQDGQCVAAPAGTAGAACKGSAAPGSTDACGTGLECCESMQGDGQGGLTEAGESGRCAACCGLFPADGGCASDFQECCDGECRFTDMDLEHCGGCAYAGGGGYACVNGLTACTPAMRCGEGVCIYRSGCPNVGEQAFECRLPARASSRPRASRVVRPTCRRVLRSVEAARPAPATVPSSTTAAWISVRTWSRRNAWTGRATTRGATTRVSPSRGVTAPARSVRPTTNVVRGGASPRAGTIPPRGAASSTTATSPRSATTSSAGADA